MAQHRKGTGKGWKREPSRHALAARGIKTTIRRPSYIPTMKFSHPDTGRFVLEDTEYLVGYMVMVPKEKLFDKFKYITPGMFFVTILRSGGGGSEIVVSPFIDEGSGFYSNSRSEPGVPVHLEKDITDVTRGDVDSVISLQLGEDVAGELRKAGLQLSSKYYLLPGDTGIIVEPEYTWREGADPSNPNRRGPEFKGSKFRRISKLRYDAGSGRWSGRPISKWVRSPNPPHSISPKEVLSAFFKGVDHE